MPAAGSIARSVSSIFFSLSPATKRRQPCSRPATLTSQAFTRISPGFSISSPARICREGSQTRSWRSSSSGYSTMPRLPRCKAGAAMWTGPLSSPPWSAKGAAAPPAFCRRKAWRSNRQFAFCRSKAGSSAPRRSLRTTAPGRRHPRRRSSPRRESGWRAAASWEGTLEPGRSLR